MNEHAVILVVDDERNIRMGMCAALENEHTEVLSAEDGKTALEIIRDRHIDLLITDLRMPNMDGTTLVEHVRQEFPKMPIIIITGHGTVESAVESMKHGVYDYMTKPVDIRELGIRVNRLLQLDQEARAKDERIKSLEKRVDEKFGFESIVGKSKSMEDVFKRVKMVAPSRATVLIYGESGTGKELIAEAIHQNSPRKGQPFIKVNCGALSETLLENELFGHEKGAFTDAFDRQQGRFERANNGTILLDEISETSPSFQVKLLRVLQEGTFERVGGTQTIKCDVRVIASSNKRLADLVAEKKFREDLYYRLRVVEIVLPPLRERSDDIPLLVDHFLEEFSRQYNRPKPSVSVAAMQALARAPWPGNVRELRNALEGIVVMLQGNEIDLKDLPEEISERPMPQNCVHIPIGSSMADAEREMIIATLRANKNNRAAAARILKIGRRTLYRRLEEYGIHGEDGDKDDADTEDRN